MSIGGFMPLRRQMVSLTPLPGALAGGCEDPMILPECPSCADPPGSPDPPFFSLGNGRPMCCRRSGQLVISRMMKPGSAGWMVPPPQETCHQRYRGCAVSFC